MNKAVKSCVLRVTIVFGPVIVFADRDPFTDYSSPNYGDVSVRPLSRDPEALSLMGAICEEKPHFDPEYVRCSCPSYMPLQEKFDPKTTSGLYLNTVQKGSFTGPKLNEALVTTSGCDPNYDSTRLFLLREERGTWRKVFRDEGGFDRCLLFTQASGVQSPVCFGGTMHQGFITTWVWLWKIDGSGAKSLQSIRTIKGTDVNQGEALVGWKKVDINNDGAEDLQLSIEENLKRKTENYLFDGRQFQLLK